MQLFFVKLQFHVIDHLDEIDILKMQRALDVLDSVWVVFAVDNIHIPVVGGIQRYRDEKVSPEAFSPVPGEPFGRQTFLDGVFVKSEAHDLHDH